MHLVNAHWRNFIIVKVTSDEETVGYGEATLADFEKTIEAAVYDYKPFLLGKEIDIPEIRAVSLSALLLAGRAHADERHQRDRAGALGYSGQGS